MMHRVLVLIGHVLIAQPILKLPIHVLITQAATRLRCAGRFYKLMDLNVKKGLTAGMPIVRLIGFTRIHISVQVLLVHSSVLINVFHSSVLIMVFHSSVLIKVFHSSVRPLLKRLMIARRCRRITRRCNPKIKRLLIARRSRPLLKRPPGESAR
jgi:hypothetical protein